MASLQVRELPEHLYYKLKQEAETAHRSLAQQTVITLARGLDAEVSPKMRRKVILASIQENTQELKKLSVRNPAALIREDRER